MDSNLIQTKLHAQTEAMSSDKRVENNRYHYTLHFDTDIGADWLEAQVASVSTKLGVDLDIYKIDGSHYNFSIIVREVDRRENIDDSQHSLSTYE